MRSHRSSAAQRGQASVEVVAVAPVLLLLAAIAWQLALAGWASLCAGSAARAAARAQLSGEAPRQAALAALPRPLRDGLELRAGSTAVEVRVTVPRVLPGVSLRVGAHASSVRG